MVDWLKVLGGAMIIRLIGLLFVFAGCSTTSNIQERCKELKACASKCQSKCRERFQQCRKIEGGVGKRGGS